MDRLIAVRGIAIHEGKLLCVRLRKYKENSTEEASYWCLPGGGLESGEAIETGIKREMIEETGIEPVVGNVLYIQQFSLEDKELLEFFFHIINGQDYLQVDLSKTSHGEKEIAEIAYVDPKTTHILPDFLTTEDLAGCISQNLPTRIMNRFKD